jgi:hypothetical protein
MREHHTHLDSTVIPERPESESGSVWPRTERLCRFSVSLSLETPDIAGAARHHQVEIIQKEITFPLTD